VTATDTIAHHSVRTLGVHLSASTEDAQGHKASLYKAINRYVERFAVTEDGQCVCGMPLGGLLGMFTYGIVHGEGWCSACKHPARANHYITLEGEDKPRVSWVMPLPYHPDYVTERTEEVKP